MLRTIDRFQSPLLRVKSSGRLSHTGSLRTVRLTSYSTHVSLAPAQEGPQFFNLHLLQMNGFCSDAFRRFPGKTDVVSIDFRFLVAELRSFEIPESLCAWFTSYLTNRAFCVRLGIFFSTWKVFKSGVSQGSCIGPLLFLLHTTDLRLVMKDLRE